MCRFVQGLQIVYYNLLQQQPSSLCRLETKRSANIRVNHTIPRRCENTQQNQEVKQPGFFNNNENNFVQQLTSYRDRPKLKILIIETLEANEV